MLHKILNHKITIGLILLGFTTYVIRLFVSGEINFYIHPRYASFAYVMAIIATIVIVLGFIEHHAHIHEHPDFRFRSFINIVVIIMLCVMLISPAKPISDHSMSQRTIQTPEYSEPEEALECPDTTPDTIEAIVTGIAWYGASCYENHPVELTGFVIDEYNQNLPSNMFYIGRFVISCCAIDAQTYAIPMIKNSMDTAHENDSWIKVKGTLVTMMVGGEKKLVINPTAIEDTQKPTNPYQYIGG